MTKKKASIQSFWIITNELNEQNVESTRTESIQVSDQDEKSESVLVNLIEKRILKFRFEPKSETDKL